jgi:conjugal transfer pilus assembly protein TraK
MRLKRKLLSLLLSLLLSNSALALQKVEVSPDESVALRISLTQPTRLKVDNGRVLEVLGDVFDASANPGGNLVVQKDEANGEVFFSLRNPSNTPYNIFLKTENGTYAVILQPVDMPLETISIVEKGGAKTPVSNRGTGTKSANLEGVNPGAHARVIKNIMRVMAQAYPEQATGVQKREVNREFRLWEGVKFTLRNQYVVGDYVGEEFYLQNTGIEHLVVREPEFFKSGVAAVAIRRMDLAPGQQTAVYIVRARTTDD